MKYALQGIVISSFAQICAKFGGVKNQHNTVQTVYTSLKQCKTENNGLQYSKLDGVGPVNNRPSIYQLAPPFLSKKIITFDKCHMT